ncbi:Tn3 family transposase [Rhizobium altiplani]|uniref:Tn3 family transposase n=1 Tax=Rhizobium altiplani TaxID=1864509 RepID=UPI0024781A40|nr:Tn3 family transposase [Rhizobium altiplani]
MATAITRRTVALSTILVVSLSKSSPLAEALGELGRIEPTRLIIAWNTKPSLRRRCPAAPNASRYSDTRIGSRSNCELSAPCTSLAIITLIMSITCLFCSLTSSYPSCGGVQLRSGNHRRIPIPTVRAVDLRRQLH